MKKTLTALALATSLLSAKGQASAQEHISAKEKIEKQIKIIAGQVKTIRNTGYEIDIDNDYPFNCSYFMKDLEIDVEDIQYKGNDLNPFDITIFTKDRLEKLGFGTCDEAKKIGNGNLPIINELIDKNSTK